MHRKIIVIQARLSSSRLPAKTLLNINGLSFIQNIGLRVYDPENYDLMFVFPVGIEGDILERNILELNLPLIKIKKGHLTDLLCRFNDALINYSEEDIIVRLTADNIVPDRFFIKDFLENYQCGYAYSEINEKAYGVSAEAFRIKHLRDAYANAKLEYEREHVTPYVAKKYGTSKIKSSFIPSHEVRLTLDTFQDFLNIQYIFSQFNNCVTVHWKDIIEKAISLFPPVSKLMIGTVQFGLDYGITNKQGKTSSEDITKIIHHANKKSILYYDTAPAYGDSEKKLGDNNNILSNSIIITKLNKNIKNKEDVENSILKSKINIKKNYLDGVLLHQFSQFRTEIWDILLRLKEEKHIKKVGVSVYTPEEAIIVAQTGQADIVQLPYNIIDPRWEDFIYNYSNKIEVHCRSIFLQGSLLDNNILKQKHQVEIGKKLDFFVKKFNRINRLDLCLTYIKSQNWIDKIIIGINNFEQFLENVKFFETKNLSYEEICEIKLAFQDKNEAFLDVRKW